MGPMTDMMVDLETTGTSARSGIIQIGAIKFNPYSREIGGVFDRCPTLLPFRLWDDDTREFWQVKHKDIYHSFVVDSSTTRMSSRSSFTSATRASRKAAIAFGRSRFTSIGACSRTTTSSLVVRCRSTTERPAI